MRLLASDLIALHRPAFCALRLHLRERGEPEEEPGPYDQVLRKLGIRHEQQHLATLGPYVDLNEAPELERAKKTVELIGRPTPVIYQPRFEVQTVIDGTCAAVVGQPDFLILDGPWYVIRDSKMSRRIDEKNHPEIILQVQLYGWLFEQTLGRPPRELQVHSGRGDVVTVPYDGGAAALRQLAEIVRLKLPQQEPYEPVGWTKCTGCGYCGRCWETAVARGDVALVPDIDQSLAKALHQVNVRNRKELLQKFDVGTLSEFKRPWGDKTQRVGKRSERILLLAEVMEAGEERILARPAIPRFPNYVMFDLEGMPPHLDELEKIYLWGMQVFGERPSEFLAATAGFGDRGDESGWNDFLKHARHLFDVYGDIPFVHWHHYEKTNLKKYVDRFGDPDGIAVRVMADLLDLFPIAKEAVALPVPSYSLKVIEKYVGYERKQSEYGGDWAMATFIEATETNDEGKRSELVNQILDYNREDLEATWVVFQWLRTKIAAAAATGS